MYCCISKNALKLIFLLFFLAFKKRYSVWGYVNVPTFLNKGSSQNGQDFNEMFIFWVRIRKLTTRVNEYIIWSFIQFIDMRKRHSKIGEIMYNHLIKAIVEGAINLTATGNNSL